MKINKMLCALAFVTLMIAGNLFGQGSATVPALTDLEKQAAPIMGVDISGAGVATSTDSAVVNPIRRAMRSNAKAAGKFLRMYSELVGTSSTEYREIRDKARFAYESVKEYDRAMIGVLPDSMKTTLSVKVAGQPSYSEMLEAQGKLATVVRPAAFGNLATKADLGKLDAQYATIIELLKKQPAPAATK